MGAETFTWEQRGAIAERAFADAREQASHEYGHGGYTGTIAEKSDFTLITRTPMWLDDALKTADRLVESDDPRVSDKWGPAGAIPFVSPTRRETARLTNVTVGQEEAAIKAAVTLKRGESIKSFRFCGGTYGNTRNVYLTATFEVEILRANAPQTRTATITVKAAAGNAPTISEGGYWNGSTRFSPRGQESVAWFDNAVATAARPRKGERVAGFSIIGADVTYKVQATAPKGKTLTRYVVTGSQRHGTWNTGFASQSDARAYIVDALANAQGHDIRTYEIEAVTRREDGSPLVSVTRVASKATYTIEVTYTITPEIPATQTPDGWLFFGWASS